MNVLLIVYDNDSHIHWFPMGIAYIASALRNAGHNITIYSQDIYHFSESHLTEYLNKNAFDVVGLGATGGYYQYRKLLMISRAINNANTKPFYVLGGHGPSPEPEYFLKKTNADVVCIGEAEITVVELLHAFENKRSLHTVKGIAFLEDGRFILNPRQQLIQTIDSISYPAWDLFDMNYYSLLRMPHIENKERSFPVLSGRGCPFTCNFCYRMDTGFRPRAPGAIIEEIRILKEKYNVNYIFFLDELLMSSEERTKKICQAITDSGLGVKWSCAGRLNYAKPDVLKMMKKAGCVYINYGIECMDDQVLKNMNKILTVAEIKEGIKNTLAEGISPGFNIIFGNIGENAETLRKGVDFLLQYDDGAELRTIRPVTPYPGSPLYYYAIEKGLLKDAEDFYENKHTNSDLLAVNFTELSDEDFHRLLFEANEVLIKNYFKDKAEAEVQKARKLYFNKDATFRGFRQT